MCKFFSAIVTKNGDLYYNKFTHSHEDLIDLFNLREGLKADNFIRIEYYPENNDLSDLLSYQLHVDEQSIPEWFNDDLKEQIVNKLNFVLEKMIISNEEKKILIGDCYILKDSTIKKIQNCIIFQMRGNSQVGVLRGNSQVGELRENSQVGVLRENSQVGVLWGNSQVGELWENSQVGELWGNSQVGVLRGNSQVGELWENSKVGELRGNSKIKKDNRILYHF
jgi:hypothetical protein